MIPNVGKYIKYWMFEYMISYISRTCRLKIPMDMDRRIDGSEMFIVCNSCVFWSHRFLCWLLVGLRLCSCCDLLARSNFKGKKAWKIWEKNMLGVYTVPGKERTYLPEQKALHAGVFWAFFFPTRLEKSRRCPCWPIYCFFNWEEKTTIIYMFCMFLFKGCHRLPQLMECSVNKNTQRRVRPTRPERLGTHENRSLKMELGNYLRRCPRKLGSEVRISGWFHPNSYK